MLEVGRTSEKVIVECREHSLGWGVGERGFLFLFSFSLRPLPFHRPPTGTRGTHPGTDYKGAEYGSPPSAAIGHGSRVSLWAGQEQDSMSYNLPWRKGQQSGKALNRSQERRGEGEKVQTLSLKTGEGWEPAYRGSDTEQGGKDWLQGTSSLSVGGTGGRRCSRSVWGPH